MSDAPRPTRYSALSLQDVVCLCAGPRDNEAWEEFIGRIRKPITMAIARTATLWGDSSRNLIEDLAQVTYLKLWEGGSSMVQSFAAERPEALLGYVVKIATNATHDYFKHRHSQSSGGAAPHVSTSDVDPAARAEIQGTQEQVDHGVLFREIDELLKRGLSGPDEERDRMIFWLYFRQGMTTSEIALVPTVELSAKGVGSVIERLKNLVREQILGPESDFEEFAGKANSAQKSY